MDVHEYLTKATQSVKEYKKLVQRAESVENMILKEEKLRDELEKVLIDEGRDLEKLDGFKLLNIWHSLRGTKEEAKRKEEEEYLAAKLKYDDANAALQALRAELRVLKKELTARADPQQEYEKALKKKEEYLLTSPGTAGHAIIDLDEEIGYLKAQNTEIKEAIDIGEKALESLSKVLKSFSSAKGWGALDILGGGLIITSIKHSRINDAQRELQYARDMLNQFKRELADVNMDYNLDISRVATAADFLLDGLVFDLIVQSKINNATDRTKQTQNTVFEAVNNLKKMLDDNHRRHQELTAKRNQIIEDA